MERKFEIDGREHTGEVEELPGRSFRGGEGLVKLTIDGREHRVEVMERGAHHLDLILDGERRVVVHTATGGRGETWASAGGRARVVREKDERAARGLDGGAAGPAVVTPQFPATVVRVHVEEGDAVTRGEPVVTVSAMKMEMTLTAPYGGTVTAVNTREGASVSPGDVLVEIEEEAHE